MSARSRGWVCGVEGGVSAMRGLATLEDAVEQRNEAADVVAGAGQVLEGRAG